VVISTSVLILNDVIPHLWIMSFVEMVQLNDIGNPRWWLNGSPIYREYMLSIYYLIFIGSIVMFSINLAFKGIAFEQIKQMPTWKNVLGTIFLFSLLYMFFYMFGHKSPILSTNELKEFRLIRLHLNTIFGLVIIESIIIVLSGYCAQYVKWLVWFFRSKMNRSININPGDNSE